MVQKWQVLCYFATIVTSMSLLSSPLYIPGSTFHQRLHNTSRSRCSSPWLRFLSGNSFLPTCSLPFEVIPAAVDLLPAGDHISGTIKVIYTAVYTFEFTHRIGSVTVVVPPTFTVLLPYALQFGNCPDRVRIDFSAD